MPEQISLTEYGVVVTAATQQNMASRDLTAVIVKLEPSVYGRCSLCLRRGELGFCLKYLNSESETVLWCPVCETCAKEGAQRK